MTVLTSTGAVNLTSATNWSPAQIPVNGDDLVIGAHTLTLDADLTLDSITFNNASSRLAISGTTRSVQATNGFIVATNLSAQVITAAIPTGTSLTLTGQWSGFNLTSGIASSTGGNLTLRTVGASQSAVLFADVSGGIGRAITASWTGGTLTTIGRLDLPSWTSNQTIVTMTGGTWSHQSSGMNSFGTGTYRVCSLAGTATVNWTGSIDSNGSVTVSGLFVLNSSSVSHTIGQAGDTFCLRNANSSATSYTALIVMQSGVVELVGRFTGRLDAHVLYLTGGTVNWRNQSQSIPSTDHCMIANLGGTVNVSGLALSNAGKFLYYEIGSGTTTASAGTSITCTSTAAQACAIGTTALDGMIVVLESSPATLPTAAQVAAGVSYGYSGAPQTGTGIIMDPATLATAMLTSFSSLPEVLVRTTIATLTSQTEFTLTAGSSDNDVYNSTNGTVAIITDQVTSAQKAVVAISDYVGSTRTVTLSAAPGFTVATGDLITIIAGAAGGGGGGGLDAAGVRAAIGMASANLDSQLAAIDDFIDTEVAAIKAKTDNLPSDPADASDIAAAFSTVNSTLATIAAYIDTEVAAIKAKTDNLPSDPADASEIAASFSSIASTLSTIAAYIDTEVAAIKSKTDNLPTDPADQSLVEAAITAATTGLATATSLANVEAKVDAIDNYVDTEVAAIKAKTDLIPSDIGSVLIAANSNREVMVTGSKHVAADVHEFQTSVIDSDAIAPSAVTELQAGLATASELAKVPKAGETRRYTQIAANSGSKTADVSIGNPLP